MRSITTAAAFAIAASLAAGQESGKSGKSGTKSSKSGDCIDCSADSLIRANTATNLFFSNWAVNGTINQDSLFEYCAADDDTREAFRQAVGNSIPDGQFFAAFFFLQLIFRAPVSFSEGELLSDFIDIACSYEQLDDPICFDECGCDDPIPDACDFLQQGASTQEALALVSSEQLSSGGITSFVKEYIADHYPELVGLI